MVAAHGDLVQPEIVSRMVRDLGHRGPDAARMVASKAGDSVLGMTSLAIVSPGRGFGPYTDPATGVTVTYNGEIYDYRNVAARLGVELAPNDTDGSFILRAYLQCGAGFVDRIDGMFAIAIHDPCQALTFLIRDPIGQKPLHYRVVGAQLHFASEVKAILGDLSAAVDLPDTVVSVETPVGSVTPYSGVRLLEAGTTLQFDHRTGVFRIWKYWSITDAAQRSEADWVESYTQALLLSTQEQRSAGEEALLLSGGLDSGVLAHLMQPAVC
ncbi:MAG: hypothetical protein ACRCSP_07540, partial [Rhodoglobus sp.]